MDNTREKLIELLVNSPGLCTLSGKEEEFAENADWLIANGVTLDNQVSSSKWISVKDRLPFAEYGESDDVLAITELGVMRTLYFDGGNWCFQNGECCSHKVTHWMPLPEPPKGD